MGLLGSGTLQNGGTHWSFDDITRADGSSTASKKPCSDAGYGNSADSKLALLEDRFPNKRSARSVLDLEPSPKKIKVEDDLESPSSFKSLNFDKPTILAGKSEISAKPKSKFTGEVIDLLSSEDDEPPKAKAKAQPKVQQPTFSVLQPSKSVDLDKKSYQSDVKPVIRYTNTAQTSLFVEDSSDEEVAPARDTRPPSVTHNSHAPNSTVSKPTISEETKAAQREESRRLRESAEKRKVFAARTESHDAMLAVTKAAPAAPRDISKASTRSEGVESNKRPLSKAVPGVPSSSKSSPHGSKEVQLSAASKASMTSITPSKDRGVGVRMATKAGRAPISATESPLAGRRGDLRVCSQPPPAIQPNNTPTLVGKYSLERQTAGAPQLDAPALQPTALSRKIKDEEALSKINAIKLQASLDAARSAELERVRAERALESKKQADKAALESRRRSAEESRRGIRSRLQKEAIERKEVLERHKTRQKLNESNKVSLELGSKEREEQRKQREAKETAQKQERLEQKRLKDEKAKKMKERNARNAQADKEAEEKARNAQSTLETEDQGLVLENPSGKSTAALPYEMARVSGTGPFSLNSAAGRLAMSSRTASSQQASLARVPPSSNKFGPLPPSRSDAWGGGPREIGQRPTHRDKISHEAATSINALGVITPHDAQLYVWKELEDFIWSQIIESWATLTGVVRSEDYLRKRWRSLKELVKHTEVDVALMKRLVTGDRNADEQVNRLAREVVVRVPVEQHRPTIQLAVRKDSFVAQRRPSPVQGTSNTSNAPATISTRVNNDDDLARAAATPRPTTGGKHINATLLAFMAENVAEACSEAKSQDEASNPESEMTPEDFCYNIYRIFCREFTLDDENLGRQPEDMPWIECCDAYDNVDEANSAAKKFLRFTKTPAYRYPDEEFEELRSAGLARNLRNGFPAHDQGDDNHDYEDSEEEDEDDEERFDMPQARPDAYASSHAPVVGEEKYFSLQRGRNIVHVRVVAELRRAMPPIPPKSKKGWLSRTCWRVKQRTCSDPLFGETVVEEEVDKDFYTDLTMANSIAVMHFVEKTVKPSSPSLDMFCAEKSRIRGELMMGLDAGDIFHKRAEQGEGWLEVWVEESKLRGPRN